MRKHALRMAVQKRGPDGDWEEVAGTILNNWEAEQMGLILGGVDLVTYAALPAAQQARIYQNLLGGMPANMAMD